MILKKSGRGVVHPTSRFASSIAVATCSIATLCVLVSTAAHAVPALLPVQGFLTDEDGEPLDDAVSVILSLYESPTGAEAALFSEFVSVDVDQGSFFHYLGSETPLDLSLIEQANALYLGIEIDGEALEPRLALGTVPFAALAGRAQVAEALLIADIEVTGAGLQRRIALPCPAGAAIASVAIDGIPVCIDVNAGAAGGDITAATAGDGLAGGGLTGAVELAVNFAETQRRISAACPSDQFAISVNEDGTLACQAPPVSAADIEGVVAGAGLTGGGLAGTITLALAAMACPANNFQTGIAGNGAPICDIPPAGDIEQVIAGSGLAGGGTAGAVTLTLAAAACPANQFQTGVNAAGAAICDLPAGDIAQVIAGGGLAGGGTAGAVTLTLAAAACPANQFQIGVDAAGAAICDLPAGDIAQVTAGGGLAGGGTAGVVTLSLAAAACPANQFQTGVDGAGAPICALESGSITQITAGAGLTGGGTTDDVTLSVDSTVIQQRVLGCITGQLITAIAQDGTPTCVDFPEIKFQTKSLPADVQTVGSVGALSFSGLTVGRVYRIRGQVAVLASPTLSAPATVRISVASAGITVGSTAFPIDANQTFSIRGPAGTFIATNTTALVSISGFSAVVGEEITLLGNGTTTESFMILEELGNAVATTEW